MSGSLREHCLRSNLEEQLSQWAAEQNAPLTPDTVGFASHRRIWWRCARGHEWQASPDGRKRGAGCPYCAGKKPLPGVNDLATVCPSLAKEWHPTRNGALTPRDVLPGSKRLVWWRCEQGHEWMASPKSRLTGAGCPACGELKRQVEGTLAVRYPDLAREWHPTRNGVLTPEDVSPRSPRVVWWRCENGHAWRASVRDRAEKDEGCPVCSGKKLLPGENDLATLYPALAAEWAPDNEGVAPADVTPFSRRRVWWQCANGHRWRATVAARVKGEKPCPFCAGRKDEDDRH